MNGRPLYWALRLLLLLLTIASPIVTAQLQPLRLKLVRESSFDSTIGLNSCIEGDLYLAAPVGSGDPTGTLIAHTLELPDRSNHRQISAIPVGTYTGKIRTGGKRGWRIELNNVEGRDLVQIHVGNTPDETLGCILLGERESANVCRVKNSRAAMKALEELYGTATSRPIHLAIE